MPKNPSPPAEPASYETAMAELERLVAQMEAGSLPLDQLLGSYRRGADLWVPTLNTPMQDSLLWVYEGQTQYWGNVLAARSGMRPLPASIDALFDWIWAQGNAADSAEALEPVREALGVPAEAIGSAETKAMLRNCTEIALSAGVFGVPTLALGNALFWGNDAHAFAVAVLRDPALLDEAEMRRVAGLPVGVQRG